MPKVLVVHGAGMNMRGKSQIEVFGPLTLAEYDEHIRQYAAALTCEVEIFHSNIEGEVINRFYDAFERKFDGAIINPADCRLHHRPPRAVCGNHAHSVPGDRGAPVQPGDARPHLGCRPGLPQRGDRGRNLRLPARAAGDARDSARAEVDLTVVPVRARAAPCREGWRGIRAR